MATEQEARAERARERSRRAWVRLTTLDDASDPSPVSGIEGIALLTELSAAAWALSGRPLPSYPRAEIPVRVIDRKVR